MNTAPTADGEAPIPASPAPAPPSPEPGGGGRGEDSGAHVRGAPAALRIGLLGLLVLAAGGFGLFEARFLPRVPGLDPVFRPRRARPGAEDGGFPFLAGDLPLAREPVAVNGREVDSLRFASPRTPEQVAGAYLEHLRPLGYEPVRDVRAGDALGMDRFVRFLGRGQAMLGFKAPDGGFLGVLAFANDETGGSDGFVIREGPPPEEARPAGGGPGRDPPGVEPPLGGIREFCVERKGPRPSFLVLYRSQAPPGAIERSYRERMPRAGWDEPAGAPEAFDGAGEGAHLLFRRGAELCLVTVGPSGEAEGESWVTVMVRSRER